MRYQQLFLLITASLLTLPAQAAAQRIESAVDGIRPGTMVRIAIRDSQYVGTLISRTQHDVNVVRYRDSLSIPSRDIRAFWVADGRATWDGFVSGALIGGGLGLVVGLLYGGMWCESSCGSQLSDSMIMGAVAGGAAVGVVGAALGSLSPHWKKVFP